MWNWEARVVPLELTFCKEYQLIKVLWFINSIALGQIFRSTLLNLRIYVKKNKKKNKEHKILEDSLY